MRLSYLAKMLRPSARSGALPALTAARFPVLRSSVPILATFVGLFGGLFGAQASAVALSATAIDFNRDIRPILSANCYACHGPDAHARKAGLRLDVAEAAYATSEDGITAIKPRDLAASELWKRITSTDADVIMPPPESHRALTEEDKAKIRAWIEAGAPYAEHWAFVAPKKMPLADIALNAPLAPLAPLDGLAPSNAGQPAPPLETIQAIDTFVRARLEREGVTSATETSREASRATLARRLALDLTGLPPSTGEVAAFVRDTAPDYYERYVRTLMSSPHFGEKMALPWLDAARYADTNGFSIDGGRHAWLWRDYVINAFNKNKPYDRFLLEQIAGDLLPDKNEETITATGFQRNAMITHEGGTIAEENLVTYGADRVKTYGEAVLGLTLACAQCHDHKYDPISQREYYQLFAYFNQTTEPAHGGDGGVNAAPTARVKSVLVTREENHLRMKIAELEERMANPDSSAVAAWEARELEKLRARGANLMLYPTRVTRMSTPNTGSGFEIVDERFACVKRPMSFLAFDMALEPTQEAAAQLAEKRAPITGLRIVMHPSPDALQAGWGYGGGENGKNRFAVTSVTVSAGTVPGDQVNLYRIAELASATANSWVEPALPSARVDIAGDGRPDGVLETRGDTAWIPDLATEGPVHLTVTFKEPLDPALATHFTVQVNFGRYGDIAAKRMEFFLVTGTDDGTNLPANLVDALVNPAAGARDPLLNEAFRAHFARYAPEAFALRSELANARERLAVRTESFDALVMDTAPTPRETRILHRGNYADPREVVTAGTPEVLSKSSALNALSTSSDAAPQTRLSLAQWTISHENPLVARVAVNRIWQIFFGTGLVKTAADFGMQGEVPSHPELLDWLAVDFVESGWNVKRLVQAIVMSRTYRQSSATEYGADGAEQLDPENRLLARGPRFRLPAELIRDHALKTSGLLVKQFGGPSVNPYTPGDPWREISHFGSSPATAQTFVQDHGDKLYRRSLYTYWKRTMPPPNMASFDAPNREVCVVDRATTNTPLQALVLLNDVQFVEAARAFAERALALGGDDERRLEWAFREATSRAPDEREMDVLSRALARERAEFAADRASADALLAHGESPRNASIAPEEHAAWTQVAALILNLSEIVTRN
jgi:hypothetical protein